MKNKLLIFLIIFFSFLFLRSLIRSNSISECPSPCILIIKPRQMGEIGGDHFFEDMFQELLSSADENHVNHQIYVDYYRNNSDGLFYQTGLWRNLQAPRGRVFESGRIYRVEVQNDVFNRQFMNSVEEFDRIYTHSNQHGVSFYDLCWEYDCQSRVTPYKKLPSPKKLLFLGVVKKTPYIDEQNKISYYKVAYDPTHRKKPLVPAYGDVDVAILTFYEDYPPPADDFAVLKSDAPHKSFNYVSAWYKKESEKYFGEDAINIKITFIDKQKHFGSVENYRVDDKCYELSTVFLPIAEEEYIEVLLGYDVIVFIYIGESANGCKAHLKSVGSPYIFLFPTSEMLKEFPEEFVDAFAHELGHAFSATDKYIVGVRYQTGSMSRCWYESDKSEELGRDIMCAKAPTIMAKELEGLPIPPTAPGTVGFWSPPLSGLVITEQTAKEIGWYDLDGDGVLEVEDPCPWDKENLCK